MDWIDRDEREILRELAKRQLELAHNRRNEEIMKQWDSLAHRRREAPTVRLLFSNFPGEVIAPRQKCHNPLARRIEEVMLWTMTGRELFDDDTPISPTYDIRWKTWCKPFGIAPKKTPAREKTSNGYHIDPVITDLSEELDLLKGGNFGVNRQETREYVDRVNDVIGDLLPVRMVMPSLPGSMTNPLVHLMGMEDYYFAMYDYPEELHKVMDMAATVYENYYDFLEKEHLLLPTVGTRPINQESFAFNDVLPEDNITSTRQCWGFLESQETTAVSPELFGEFVFPYQDRLARRFGLLTYGCCERVDDIWPDYLSKWKHLRKLSVSPFNKEEMVGEFLRGTDVIYYSKPRAEFVTAPGNMDEDALRVYFKGVCHAASGCLFEMAQREVGTIYGEWERGRRYVQIARECIAEYWRP